MKFWGPSFWTQNGYDDENDTIYIKETLKSVWIVAEVMEGLVKTVIVVEAEGYCKGEGEVGAGRNKEKIPSDRKYIYQSLRNGKVCIMYHDKDKVLQLTSRSFVKWSENLVRLDLTLAGLLVWEKA